MNRTSADNTTPDGPSSTRKQQLRLTSKRYTPHGLSQIVETAFCLHSYIYVHSAFVGRKYIRYKNHVKLVIQSDKYLLCHYWFSAS